MSSSVDFLVWSRGGNTRMGMFGGSIRMVLNRSFLSLSDSRQLSSLYRLFSACFATASVHHTYVGEDRRTLASPCTGLSTDRSLFFLCPLSAPLLFKKVLRSTSLEGLPFRLGLGRVMDAIGYSSGLLAQFASYPYSDAILF